MSDGFEIEPRLNILLGCTVRKLVLGIIDVATDVGPILEGITKTSWLPQGDTNQVVETLREGWDKFLGVVAVLW